MTFLLWVNRYSDKSGRTLLAWRCLIVMYRFMSGDFMWLYVTIRQSYGVYLILGGKMTSEERKNFRYLRRKTLREQKRALQCSLYDNFDWVFSYEHLYHSYKMCRRNVAWKASVQKYITQAPLNIYQTHTRLMNGKFRASGFFEFDIMERGKKRHIRSVTIGERVVQRCLCDYAIVPMLCRTFIYDNGASIKNKGYTFASRRLTQHLREHYRHDGQDGYILLFDFSKFFDNVSHRVVKNILHRYFTDERILSLSEHFIDAFGSVGLGLGSQISQILALASANRLDHYIKEICGIRGYGRYMDDGYLVHRDKAYLQQCLYGIKKICDELGIKLNLKKTQIVKLSHGFTYLKVRYYLLSSGKIIKKICHKSVTRMRRKLKSLKTKVHDGIMMERDVYQSWQSWRSYANNFEAYRSVKSVENLYRRLFE